MQEDSSEGRGGFDQKMFDYYANPETFKDTTLTVMEFPNPVLREVGKPVTDFDDKLAKLCEDMFTILYDSKGVGLSAPQVGLSLRVFVYNTDPSSPLRKMREVAVINPKITDYCEAGELDAWTDVDIEGCLSSRAECCRGHVRRAKVIEVEYQDVQGRVRTKKLRGFEARVFQHEYDHINGILHIDRQSPADRALSQPFLDALAQQHGPGGVLEPPVPIADLMPPIFCGACSGPPEEPPLAPTARKAAPEPAPSKSTTGFGGVAAKKKPASKKKKKR